VIVVDTEKVHRQAHGDGMICGAEVKTFRS